ncbi:MAG: hypothetical protein K8R46_07090 [Pirellulales bacterium]|nr:hypothetical protein [Pirellulales bacterium]
MQLFSCRRGRVALTKRAEVVCHPALGPQAGAAGGVKWPVPAEVESGRRRRRAR